MFGVRVKGWGSERTFANPSEKWKRVDVDGVVLDAEGWDLDVEGGEKVEDVPEHNHPVRKCSVGDETFEGAEDERTCRSCVDGRFDVDVEVEVCVGVLAAKVVDSELDEGRMIGEGTEEIVGDEV